MVSEVTHAIVAAAPLPMILIDSEARIVAANAHSHSLVGPGLVGRNAVAALRQPDAVAALEAVLSGRSGSHEATYHATEAMRDAVYRVTVAHLAGDGAGHVLVTFLDVTDQQEIGQIRRDFVANVSHELKTPLTALIGFIETLRGAARDDPAARDRFLTIMARETGRMDRLVRDLLSLSQVEREQRVRPKDVVDLAAVARSVFQSLGPKADEASVSLALTGAEAPAQLRGDPDQLAQVVTNLVDNAISYGGKGTRVEIGLTVRDRVPGFASPALELCVADDGAGFDPVHIPRLTERFYRVDTHRSQDKGGTGLGLAIAKHIISRHRGKLRIESRPGEGSRFTVTLPVDLPDDDGGQALGALS